jgi:hypothetical protein
VCRTRQLRRTEKINNFNDKEDPANISMLSGSTIFRLKIKPLPVNGDFLLTGWCFVMTSPGPEKISPAMAR